MKQKMEQCFTDQILQIKMRIHGVYPLSTFDVLHLNNYPN